MRQDHLNLVTLINYTDIQFKMVAKTLGKKEYGQVCGDAKLFYSHNKIILAFHSSYECI